MGTPRTDTGTLLAQRGFVADSTTYRGGGWPYLKGTLEEADEVCEILKHSKTKVSKITGTDATETTLKDLSGKRKRMLHIATHGFYWSETDARRQKRREGMRFLNMGDAQANYVEDKAMTRSGLLFSGAENTFSGVEIPAGVDDGVLTAQEISRLDLRGLDLLVLSACQTGLGEITGDGVFGLQRGFKKAGARTIVMSLWSVSDNATKDLMTQFYTALAAGKNKRQAFAEAQRYLKEHDSDYGYFPSSLRLRRPHWAAFIMLDGTDR
jgi:CHAT domain-containing protein